MLSWKDFEELEKCSFYGVERYIKKTKIGKKTSKKVLIYVLIDPRLQRLYVTKNMAKDITWHYEHPQSEDLMEHIAM